MLKIFIITMLGFGPHHRKHIHFALVSLIKKILSYERLKHPNTITHIDLTKILNPFKNDSNAIESQKIMISYDSLVAASIVPPP